MAFTEEETEDILIYLETKFWEGRRPPLEVRDRMREGQRVTGQSIELFFERPGFRDPDKWVEEPIVKISFVRSANEWNLYWQRADLKWHRYEPHPTARSLEEALDVVDKDEYACFWG